MSWRDFTCHETCLKIINPVDKIRWKKQAKLWRGRRKTTVVEENKYMVMMVEEYKYMVEEYKYMSEEDNKTKN